MVAQKDQTDRQSRSSAFNRIRQRSDRWKKEKQLHRPAANARKPHRAAAMVLHTAFPIRRHGATSRAGKRPEDAANIQDQKRPLLSPIAPNIAAFDLATETMIQAEVHLLNERRVSRRRDQQMIGQRGADVRRLRR